MATINRVEEFNPYILSNPVKVQYPSPCPVESVQFTLPSPSPTNSYKSKSKSSLALQVQVQVQWKVSNTYPSISCWSTWSLLVQQYLWLGEPQQKTSPLSSLKNMFIFKWKICSCGSKVCILHDQLSKGLLCVSKNIIAPFKRMLSKEWQSCW